MLRVLLGSGSTTRSGRHQAACAVRASAKNPAPMPARMAAPRQPGSGLRHRGDRHAEHVGLELDPLGRARATTGVADGQAQRGAIGQALEVEPQLERDALQDGPAESPRASSAGSARRRRLVTSGPARAPASPPGEAGRAARHRPPVVRPPAADARQRTPFTGSRSASGAPSCSRNQRTTAPPPGFMMSAL